MATVKRLARTEAHKAQQQGDHARQQQQQEIEEKIGRTAIAELAWIVELSQQALSEYVALDNWQWLDFFARPALRQIVMKTVIPDSKRARQVLVADIQDALSTVKTLIGGLVDGRPVSLSPAKPEDFVMHFGQDPKGRLERWYGGDLSTLVLLRTLDLLDKVGCGRLRRCPYHPEGKPVCGRVFVKRKGQQFCSRDHAQAAAYDAWVKRGRPRGGKGGKVQ